MTENALITKNEKSSLKYVQIQSHAHCVKGVILEEWVPEDTTLNRHYYKEVAFGRQTHYFNGTSTIIAGFGTMEIFIFFLKEICA